MRLRLSGTALLEFRIAFPSSSKLDAKYGLFKLIWIPCSLYQMMVIVSEEKFRKSAVASSTLARQVNFELARQAQGTSPTSFNFQSPSFP